jgi:hypothetical protein
MLHSVMRASHARSRTIPITYPASPPLSAKASQEHLVIHFGFGAPEAAAVQTGALIRSPEQSFIDNGERYWSASIVAAAKVDSNGKDSRETTRHPYR